MVSFRGDVLSQTSGVAMGTKIGRSYACHFMGHFEQKRLQQKSRSGPEMYKRYIDDGTGATSVNDSQLLGLINVLQNFHPAVQLTYDTSEKISRIPGHGHFLTTYVHLKALDSYS